jgi:hypothetical protein
VARLVASAFSRDQVTEYLAAVAISDAARKAIVILGSWPVLAGQSLMIFSGT